MDKKDKEVFESLKAKFDAEAYKEVTFGRGFTTIDAYHIVERLTEVFGLCGFGWGFGESVFKHSENNVACIGSIWVVHKEKHGNIRAVGDALVVKGNVAEAYKKAQTNMLSKASSFLGVGLSVYQGKGIDDPYLDRAEAMNNPSNAEIKSAETKRLHAKRTTKQGNAKPVEGINKADAVKAIESAKVRTNGSEEAVPVKTGSVSW